MQATLRRVQIVPRCNVLMLYCVMRPSVNPGRNYCGLHHGGRRTSAAQYRWPVLDGLPWSFPSYRPIPTNSICRSDAGPMRPARASQQAMRVMDTRCDSNSIRNVGSSPDTPIARSQAVGARRTKLPCGCWNSRSVCYRTKVRRDLGFTLLNRLAWRALRSQARETIGGYAVYAGEHSRRDWPILCQL